MANARVLIVEDETMIARDLSRQLTGAGYEVTGMIANGEEAVLLAQGTKPDLILMDIKIEGEMDGIEAASRIRSSVGAAIIFLTARSEPDLFERAKLTRPQAYLTKPVSPRELLRAVDMALYKYRIEAKMKESEWKYRMLVEQSLQGLVIAQSNPIRLSFVNGPMQAITGYSPNELMLLGPKELVALIHEDDRQEFFRNFQDRLAGKDIPPRREYRIIHRNGEIRYVDVFSSLVEYDAERATQTLFIDITDRKRAEAEKALLQKQLLQAQKLESVATLAGGIAHDFNNVLQVVLGYSDLLLLRKKPTDHEYQELNAIRRAARRGADLAKRILAFSRRLEPIIKPVNLNHEIRRMAEVLRRTVPKMIEIETLLADNLMTVSADPGQMEQILLNLSVNAQHAMSQSGRLTIKTANVTLDEEYWRTHLDVEPGKYVLMTVSDTGHGMEKEVVERIFEPFFTTKGPGEGTGLGLAMVYGIVKSHGGYITCYSEPGTGTTFRIYLPAFAEEIEPDVATNDQRDSVT